MRRMSRREPKTKRDALVSESESESESDGVQGEN